MGQSMSAAEKNIKAAREVAKFVGPAARQAFFDRLPKAARRYANLGAESSAINDSQYTSPRMRYIIELLRSKRLPWPTILRKDSSPKKLSLEGLGLGDEVALIIAKSLYQFPELQSLNLSSNRLHTSSVQGILQVNVVSKIHVQRRLDDGGWMIIAAYSFGPKMGHILWLADVAIGTDTA